MTHGCLVKRSLLRALTDINVVLRDDLERTTYCCIRALANRSVPSHQVPGQASLQGSEEMSEGWAPAPQSASQRSQVRPSCRTRSERLGWMHSIQARIADSQKESINRSPGACSPPFSSTTPFTVNKHHISYNDPETVGPKPQALNRQAIRLPPEVS